MIAMKSATFTTITTRGTQDRRRGARIRPSRMDVTSGCRRCRRRGRNSGNCCCLRAGNVGSRVRGSRRISCTRRIMRHAVVSVALNMAKFACRLTADSHEFPVFLTFAVQGPIAAILVIVRAFRRRQRLALSS